MNQFIVFLRGVNVGGNSTVKMDVLKKILSENEFSAVASYINSGNLVVTTLLDQVAATTRIKELINKEFQLSIEVFCLTTNTLSELLKNDPMNSAATSDGSRKMIMLLNKTINKEEWENYVSQYPGNETIHRGEGCIYVFYPDGAGKSKFTTHFIEKKFKVMGTARNWNTLEKMLTLSQQ